MKKCLLVLSFCGILIFPFVQAAQAIPTTQEVLNLMAAIQGGNDHALLLYHQLFPTQCPQRLLNLLIAQAARNNHMVLAFSLFNEGTIDPEQEGTEIMLADFFAHPSESLAEIFGPSPEA